MVNRILRLLLITILCSCAGPKPPPVVINVAKDKSQSKAYTFVPEVYDKFTLADARAFKVGMWALYKVKEKTTYDIKISVVAQKRDGLWVELTKVKDSDRKEEMSIQLVSAGSKVLAAFYTENGGFVVKQNIAPEPQKVEAEWPKTEEKIMANQKVQCQAGNFTADLHLYTKTDEDGSQTIERKFVSKDVPPLYEGGLVLCQSDSKNIELVAFGNDAKPSITIPRK